MALGRDPQSTSSQQLVCMLTEIGLQWRQMLLPSQLLRMLRRLLLRKAMLQNLGPTPSDWNQWAVVRAIVGEEGPDEAFRRPQQLGHPQGQRPDLVPEQPVLQVEFPGAEYPERGQIQQIGCSDPCQRPLGNEELPLDVVLAAVALAADVPVREEQQ